jgi:polyhydroxyalkanoate synthesis regulator phasin
MRDSDYNGLTSLHTGRRVLEKGHVFVGNTNDIEEPHLISDGVLPLGKDNIWVGDANCVAQESDKLKELISKMVVLRYELSLIEQNATFILQRSHSLLPKAQALNKLPNGVLKHKDGVVDIATLNQGQVYVGDATNQPVSQQTISIDNLPGLTWSRIWRGNLLGRPVESDDLTILEGKVTALEAQVATIESEIVAIQEQIAEIIAEQLLQQQEIVALQAQVAALEGAVAALQVQVAAIGTALAALQAEVTALGITVAGHTLTLIGVAASIASINFSISSIKSRLDTIESAQISLLGDVIGTGTLFTPIVTTFTKTLNQIPNNGDINIAGFNLKNLNDQPQDSSDAVNVNFLWKMLNEEVGVIWQ